nr:MAG TPA: hypothetical protein [Caudoviricetes sp.]DAX18716.1 MAG TPA: hypothetical protein [Caudoviricetes sp.]
MYLIICDIRYVLRCISHALIGVGYMLDNKRKKR